MVILFLGMNNFYKSGSFHVLSKIHQYRSYYDYFAHIIYADKNKISEKSAIEILSKKEKDWIVKNNIDYNLFVEGTFSEDIKSLEKVVKYRNKLFFEIVKENPLFTLKYFMKNLITMSIIHPFWTHGSYYIDNTSPEAKLSPRDYYHKNLLKNIIYSIFIYFFVLIGLISFLKRINKKS